MFNIQTLVVGQLQTNCYLVSDRLSNETLIIDPGDDASYISDVILRDKLIPTAILATHGHFDHILGAFELQHSFSIPFYVHPSDMFLLQRMRKTAEHYLRIPIVEPPPIPDPTMQKSTRVMVGSSCFDSIDAPGHTPGGVSFYCKKEGVCFVGDTVFAHGAVGDWRHDYSDKALLLQSVKKILSLPEKTMLYPGHGDRTTIEEVNQSII
jgi:glyoxylase-like metal-dependent hydrolase (beta-lactamase superfamily II)